MPNPGRIGLGAVIIAPDGQRHTQSQATQYDGCNNEAEVRALMAALQKLKLLGARNIRVHCDNSVVVEQVTGRAARPVTRLADLFDEARMLLASFEHTDIVWVPRHRNGDADALARAALGMGAKPVGKAKKARR